MTPGAKLQNSSRGIMVNVPLKLKKRGGRKEVIMPQAFASGMPERPAHQEALVIALARAHRWQRLFDEGKFETITELAEAIGLDRSYVARISRLTLLAPDIVEAILMGNEPSGLSFRRIMESLTMVWERQRDGLRMLPKPDELSVRGSCTGRSQTACRCHHLEM